MKRLYNDSRTTLQLRQNYVTTANNVSQIRKTYSEKERMATAKAGAPIVGQNSKVFSKILENIFWANSRLTVQNNQKCFFWYSTYAVLHKKQDLFMNFFAWY